MSRTNESASVLTDVTNKSDMVYHLYCGRRNDVSLLQDCARRVKVYVEIGRNF